MQENNLANYDNIEDELYDLTVQIVFNKDFSKLAKINQLLEKVPINSDLQIYKILLFYIYYMLLRADEREVISHLKSFIIESLLCFQEQLVLSKPVIERNKTEEPTLEEQYIDNFLNMILHKYNPDWGKLIEDFDYTTPHKFNTFVYKTRYCKFQDYFLIFCFLWGGLYMDSFEYFTQYDKDVFQINCERLLSNLPNPNNPKNMNEENEIIQQANTINFLEE